MMWRSHLVDLFHQVRVFQLPVIKADIVSVTGHCRDRGAEGTSFGACFTLLAIRTKDEEPD